MRSDMGGFFCPLRPGRGVDWNDHAAGRSSTSAEWAGPSRAREIVYTADQYDAPTFERWNIINRVVPDENLERETRAFAECLANGATLAYAAGKRFVRAYLERGIRAADTLVDEIAPALFETTDMRAASLSMAFANFATRSPSTVARVRVPLAH